MKKAARLMSAFAALAFGTAVANAQTPDAAAASSASALQLSAVDDNFIAQAQSRRSVPDRFRPLSRKEGDDGRDSRLCASDGGKPHPRRQCAQRYPAA